MYVNPEHIDIGRLLVFATYLFVGTMAAHKAWELVASGERCTDRVCLITGIAVTFIANAAWSAWAYMSHETDTPWIDAYYNDILIFIVGAVLVGGVIHIRTFTRIRCPACWLVWLFALLSLGVWALVWI